MTDECKQLMLDDFPDLVFKPVIKQLIVESDWEDWDWDDDEPWEYPDESEPELYVLDQPHSESASNDMGPMWELVINKGAWLDTDVKRKPSGSRFRIHVDSWNGQHLFWSEKDDNTIGQWVIATETGRDFLREYDKEDLIEFQPCLAK